MVIPSNLVRQKSPSVKKMAYQYAIINKTLRYHSLALDYKLPPTLPTLPDNDDDDDDEDDDLI